VKSSDSAPDTRRTGNQPGSAYRSSQLSAAERKTLCDAVAETIQIKYPAEFTAGEQNSSSHGVRERILRVESRGLAPVTPTLPVSFSRIPLTWRRSDLAFRLVLARNSPLCPHSDRRYWHGSGRRRWLRL
jgi:hypothetical protein